jgi:uncharacterized membrane protein (TIGR02234 family)
LTVAVPSARRELTAAVIGAVFAGGVALSAGGQTWARVAHDRPSPLPPVDGAVSGSDVIPLITAMGLVLLASAVALFAVRGGGRLVVGLLIVLAGALLAWVGVWARTGRLDEATANVLGIGQGPAVVEVEMSSVWPTVVVIAGVLGVAVGVFVVVRGRGWPTMGRRYERSADAVRSSARPAAPRTDDDRAQDAWKALDRGEDPTA